MKSFNQIYVSNTLEAAFGENIRGKWGLRKYDDIESPAIFFGLYKEEDISKLMKHRGISLVIWGGGDMRDNALKQVKRKIDLGRTYTFTNPGAFSGMLRSRRIKHKSFYLPIKDFSMFKPVELGDKIYVYKGWKGNRADYFKWDDVIVPIAKHFGNDRILYADNVSIEELIENYYSKCFVYVKPNPKGGCTTMWELGHMGIKTISTGPGPAPNVINFRNTKEIIKLIEMEESKIGSFQEKVSNETIKCLDLNSDWLKIKFWKDE